MPHTPTSCPVQAIRLEVENFDGIRIQEVRTLRSRPTLCRQWNADGVQLQGVGHLVRDVVAESDLAVAASFKTFVRRRVDPESWFTFLCSEGTVMAMATCRTKTPNRVQMRQMRRRMLTAITPKVLVEDDVDDRFYVLINSDHTIASVSDNAPEGPILANALKAVANAHKHRSPPTRWVAWVPGFMVEFQAMDSALTPTLATVTPVGRAAVPQLAQLTPTQAQIVRFAANGSTAPEIARSLNRSIETVRTHLRAAYRSLDVCSRIELLAPAQELTLWGAV